MITIIIILHAQYNPTDSQLKFYPFAGWGHMRCRTLKRWQWQGLTAHTADTDLSVQAGCHCNYVSSLAVDGKHVGDGAVGRLWEDAVADHAISRGGVVRVSGCHLHHRRACGEKLKLARKRGRIIWKADDHQDTRGGRAGKKARIKNKQGIFIEVRRCACQGPPHTYILKYIQRIEGFL